MREVINTGRDVLVLIGASGKDRTVSSFAESYNFAIINILHNSRHHFALSIKFKTLQATIPLLLPTNFNGYRLRVLFHKRPNLLCLAHLQQHQLVLTRPSQKALPVF